MNTHSLCKSCTIGIGYNLLCTCMNFQFRCDTFRQMDDAPILYNDGIDIHLFHPHQQFLDFIKLVIEYDDIECHL